MKRSILSGRHAGYRAAVLAGIGLGLLVAPSVAWPSSFTNWQPPPQGDGSSFSTFGTTNYHLQGADVDGDGIPNGQDQCNDTPAGAPVNQLGCPVDSDADGIADFQDRCPNTPFGQPVNVQGCPADQDADGVQDQVDQCPGTPAGFPVDGQGCITDSDRDGVPDYVDQCPNTPWGQRVGANGCILDSDGDGVHDFIDRCPGTMPGLPVGINGCPPDQDADGVQNGMDQCPDTPLGAQVDFRGCWVLNNVLFDYGKSTIQPESYPTLENVVVILRSNPALRLEIQGHTDDRGPDGANRQISENRAKSVRAFLIKKGIDANRLTAVGFGKSHPVADNLSPEGRAANRRVELRPIP